MCRVDQLRWQPKAAVWLMIASQKFRQSKARDSSRRRVTYISKAYLDDHEEVPRAP